jgi:hypothetical protein
LIDSGATDDYIDRDMVAGLKLLTTTVPGRTVVLANGVQQDGSQVVPMLKFRLSSLVDRRPFVVTKLAHYDLILGKPWLSQVNPAVDWANNIVEVHHNHHTYTLHAQVPIREGHDDGSSLNLLTASQLQRAVRHKCTVFLAVVKSSSSDDVDFSKAVLGDQSEEWKTKLHALLAKHEKMFSPLPAQLPPKRSVDHEIVLEEGHKPPFLATYHMSPAELEEELYMF